MNEVDSAPEWSARRDALASRLASAFSSHQSLLMGIVNVTPDSFSDGGSFATSESACAQAQYLCAQGADIVDIGGESTRPGASLVPPDLELARVMPVISSNAARVPLSIDTSKAQVAREAVRAGAIMVNFLAPIPNGHRDKDKHLLAHAAVSPAIGEPSAVQLRPPALFQQGVQEQTPVLPARGEEGSEQGHAPQWFPDKEDQCQGPVRPSAVRVRARVGLQSFYIAREAHRALNG